MSEINFKELVERDVRQGVSDEELAILEADPLLWRDELLLLLQQTDAKLTKAKQELPVERMEPYRYRQLMKEYNSWRATVVEFKSSICDRLRDAKSLLKETNKAASGERVFPLILEELRAIRKLLEGMQA